MKKEGREKEGEKKEKKMEKEHGRNTYKKEDR